ncbi:MAG: uroporphyrinogen-III synthase [Zoogloeaceae bacterium]|nr:uroporphyrinogen-III synthase [Zoogloeaceae bacterium]
MSLAGRCVAVTRPVAQAEGLARAIEAAGGAVLRFPVIEIVPVDPPTELEAACRDLDTFDLAFFVSANAVAHAVDFVRQRRAWPGHLAVATVGKASEAALNVRGFDPVIAPSEGFDSEAVLRLPAFQTEAVVGKQVVIFRGDGGRELLADALRARGAQVRQVTAYRRCRPQIDPTPLVQAARAGRLDALILTSSEGVRNLRAMISDGDWSLFAPILVVVPHPRIAEAARSAGLTHAVLCGAGTSAVMAALDTHLGCAGDAASVKIES